LVPSSPSELHKNKPQKWHEHFDLLLTFSESRLKASRHEFKDFEEWILNVQVEPETPLPSHPVAISLIPRFSHLFPEEIPTGFPCKRDIQHHIDLILGYVLPNKHTYRINPKDAMEIQRQVEELMSKALVRKSLSPCVTPTLLVSNKDDSVHLCVKSRVINKITSSIGIPYLDLRIY